MTLAVGVLNIQAWSPPPPFLCNVQKKAQKKLPHNFWIRAGPTPLLDNVQKEADFFLGLLPLLHHLKIIAHSSDTHPT